MLTYSHQLEHSRDDSSYIILNHLNGIGSYFLDLLRLLVCDGLVLAQ